ncbi:MAG: glycosyl hydrolase family 28 protein [Planctomycetota bacterium]
MITEKRVLRPLQHAVHAWRNKGLILAALWIAGSMSVGASLAFASERESAPTRPVTPNQFEGSDVARINQAIDAAAEARCRVVIPRINHREGKRSETWLLDSAILLRSNTTLELDNCHLKLSDRCRDNFMRSANCGLDITDIQPMQNISIRGIGRVVLEGADHPRSTGDSGKTLGSRTYGTDADVATESQTGDWRNIGILLAYVENFRIENIHLKDTHCWAISLERCAHGTLRDLDFASTARKLIDGTRQRILNQDGIDLRLGCHDILIENITGYTGDDLIALTAIPSSDRVAGSTTSTMVSSRQDRAQASDNIRDVIIRNVRGYSHGGHHIIRLLNTPGAKLHDILIDGLIDTSPAKVRCKAAIKIGDHNYGGGVAPVGDTQRILINNVTSKSTHTILVGGSLANSILHNILRYDNDGEALTIASKPEYVRNVKLNNVLLVPD